VTWLEGFAGELVRAKPGEKLADDREGETWKDLVPYGSISEDLLGHHQ
jgi:hypothetical protein